MDCEACTPHLMDLLYEELGADEASAVREHVASCEGCGDTYARLESGLALAAALPMAPAPAGSLAEVLAAAHASVKDRASNNPRAVAPRIAPREEVRSPIQDDGAEGLWASLLRWVGGAAMRPQLAMAMSLVLMVGIGLWYLPELRRDDPSDSQAIVDPTIGDEVGPTSVAPAERLALETDPRTGRIRPRADDSPVSPPSNAPTAAPEPPPANTPERPRVASAREQVRATTRTPQPERRRAQQARQEAAQLTESPAAPAPIIAAYDVDVPAGSSITGGAPGAAEPSNDDSVAGPEVAYASGATAESADEAGRLGVVEAAPAARTVARARAAGMTRPASPAAGAPPPPSASPTPMEEDLYQRGLSRYRVRNYRGAVEDLSQVVQRPSANVRAMLPNALLHLARSHRGGGNYRRALAVYQRLVSEYSSHASASTAMLEAGDCARRLGQLSVAQRWFERASNDPRTRVAAQRELARLEAAGRAEDVPANSTAGALKT